MTCNNVSHVFSQYGLPNGEGSMIALAILVALLGLVGVFGNVITIVVIARSKKLRSVFNMLILSLCCSDLVSALVSFNRLYCYTWAHCDVINNKEAVRLACKLGWRITNWMTFNTALHITGFAAFRFTSITWPSFFHKITELRIRIFIVVSWIVSFVCGFVIVFFSTIRLDRIIAYSATYLTFTAIMMSLCAGTAIMILRQRHKRKSMAGMRNELSESEKSRRAKENQKVLQLALIIGSFVLGYVPRAAFNLSIFETPPPSKEVERWIFAVSQYMCLRVSECLNPIFYNMGSSNLRKETKRTLAIFCRCKSCVNIQPESTREYSTSARNFQQPTVRSPATENDLLNSQHTSSRDKLQTNI